MASGLDTHTYKCIHMKVIAKNQVHVAWHAPGVITGSKFKLKENEDFMYLSNI